MSDRTDDLIAALQQIITANDSFRAQLPADWEGDPLNDACEAARHLIVGEPAAPTRAEMLTALEIIAGRRPSPDNLMGNADIARAALASTQ